MCDMLNIQDIVLDRKWWTSILRFLPDHQAIEMDSICNQGRLVNELVSNMSCLLQADTWLDAARNQAIGQLCYLRSFHVPIYHHFLQRLLQHALNHNHLSVLIFAYEPNVPWSQPNGPISQSQHFYDEKGNIIELKTMVLELDTAIQNGHATSIQYLLNIKANVSITSSAKALLYLIRRNDTHLFHILIPNRMELNWSEDSRKELKNLFLKQRFALIDVLWSWLPADLIKTFETTLLFATIDYGLIKCLTWLFYHSSLIHNADTPRIHSWYIRAMIHGRCQVLDWLEQTYPHVSFDRCLDRRTFLTICEKGLVQLLPKLFTLYYLEWDHDCMMAIVRSGNPAMFNTIADQLPILYHHTHLVPFCFTMQLLYAAVNGGNEDMVMAVMIRGQYEVESFDAQMAFRLLDQHMETVYELCIEVHPLIFCTDVTLMMSSQRNLDKTVYRILQSQTKYGRETLTRVYERYHQLQRLYQHNTNTMEIKQQIMNSIQMRLTSAETTSSIA